MSFTYIEYDGSGEIFSVTTRKDDLEVSGRVLKIQGDVDYLNKIIVNGSLVALTQTQIDARVAQKRSDRDESILSGLNEIKTEILAVKTNQPEVYALLKALGVLRPEVDQL